MKLTLRAYVIILLSITVKYSQAQCGAGYTMAQLNWDKLEYYYNSGTNTAPYGYSSGTYVSNAMEQTQKFAIGPSMVTFTTSAAGMVEGENGLHTDDVPNYTGDDAQFKPTANSQTITLTFASEVYNLSFSLYDIDRSQRIDFQALNGTGMIAQNINVVRYGSSIVSIVNNNTTAARVVANTTDLTSMSDDRGTVTVSVAGPVKTFRFTIVTIGSNPEFWLSDINACVPGSFPTNYQQTGNNQPLQGPVTSQKDYFIVTPDNNSAYLMDVATGEAKFLFTDPSNTYMNCFAYDPYNHILYYVSEGWPAVATNKTLKKYDFTTNTISVVIPDISTAFNIPTFDQSLEGAGGAFYNGQLYLGVEGGRFNSGNPRESMVFRIDFDGSGNPSQICQVFAVNSYNTSGMMMHDWGDFILKDGYLINYNSRTNTGAARFEHFNMMSGASTTYTSGTISASQAGMDWSGNLYSFYSDGTNGQSIRRYNGAGGFSGPLIPITLPGGTWPGGAGDAAENFRPAVDFGDAPVSYDPDIASPASSEVDPLLYIGAGSDKEWQTRGQNIAADDNYDDGTSFIYTFNANSYSYINEFTVFNNTGENALVLAWFDYNGNGTFEASEGISQVVASSASPQNIWLYWAGIFSTMSNGTYTYMRVRIVRQSEGMTTAHATGYFAFGETEDFRVPVNNYPLSVQTVAFDARLTPAKSVKLNWTINDESEIGSYIVERSANNNNWEVVSMSVSKNMSAFSSYEASDPNTLPGVSYYRLKMVGRNGMVRISETKRVENLNNVFSLSVAPNPAISKANVYIQSNSSTTKEAVVELLNSAGALVYKQNVKLVKGTNNISLDNISTLPAGRYVVQVRSENNIQMKSLILKK